MEKDKYGCKHDDGHYSKMTGNDKNVCYSIYDQRPDKPGHTGIHINYNTETGKGSIVEHGSDGKSTSTDIGCYLTTACMRYYLANFDDNCYELTVLRWFRDHFGKREDVIHYYKVAPMIVEAIEKEENPNMIYDYIYDNVVDACIETIENGLYYEAYDIYKNSILDLEKIYVTGSKKVRVRSVNCDKQIKAEQN